MITFDLSCDRNHPFEGWFRDRDDFDRQLADGILCCPVCGSSRVEKKLSAVAVHVGRRSAPAEPSRPPAAAGPPALPAPKALLHAFAEFVENHFEDVGTKFADEARKIDSGEVSARNIRGTTTAEEEASLKEEGVEFLKIALPKYDA